MNCRRLASLLILCLGLLPLAYELRAADEPKVEGKSKAAAKAKAQDKKAADKKAATEAKPDETTTPVPREGGWMKRQEAINARAKQGNVDLLFIGDSITQGWEGNGKEVWQEYYGDRNAMNAGISGDRTQHVLWRLDHGNLDGIKPKVAVMMIGTNNAGDNTSKEIAAGVKAIVDKLRSKLPETKLLVLGIFPRGEDNKDPKRKVNNGANAIIKDLADDQNVFYLDIGPSFLMGGGKLAKEIMPDLLHLSPRGYAIWAAAIEPTLTQLMNATPNSLSEAEKASGWKLLFDGKSTKGWRNYQARDVNSLWVVKDGAMTLTEKGAGDLITADQYDWFELEIEYNITPAGNSGIMYRVTEDGKKPYETGPEIQVQDNVEGHDPQRAGWLYQMYAATMDATKPAGQWNHLRIVLSPDKCEHWMNGVKYVEYVIGSDDWKTRIAQSKFAKLPLFAQAAKGYICLQDHGNVVSYRSIKIRPITDSSKGKTSMRIQKQPFGNMPDGQEVSLFTLTNANGLAVKLTDYGARIVSMHTPDRNGLMANITLGFDTLEGYLNHRASFGCATGRYANRIRAGQFTLDGHQYNLNRNNGNNHLHGGNVGFGKRLWKAESHVAGEGPAVRFTYVSPDGEENYPGTLTTTIDYTLTDDNELRLDYAATTDKPTVLNLTNHAYWNLGGAGVGDILGDEVVIAADRYVAVDSESIPTGELPSVGGTPLDFRDLHTVGQRIAQMKPAAGPTGYDHCWILGPGGPLSFAARVRDPGSGRVLEIYTTEPSIQFYTGNYLNGDPINGGY
ncbi:MAG TPA: galactose-1-epimerase, partial [Pirellulales bacterium]|nr:galactose-1-epimerase [Pirellulales bacterium]